MTKNADAHSKYVGVCRSLKRSGTKNAISRENNKGIWIAFIDPPNCSHRWRSKRYVTEREAAIAYDLKMIELGKEPVNILKPRLAS